MVESFLLLTALPDIQGAPALACFTLIRPVLEEGSSQAPPAHIHHTVQLWIKRYREKGFAGRVNHVARSDKDTSYKLPQTAVQLIKGLMALQTPSCLAASIHRQITAIAKEQRWNPPKYHRIYTSMKQLDSARVTLVHTGSGCLLRGFDLLSRREATYAKTPCGKWIIHRLISGDWMKKASLLSSNPWWSKIIIVVRL